MMKKHLNRIFLTLLAIMAVMAMPVLAGTRSETMTPPSVSGSGRDITVSWTSPSFDGVDKIEVQLVKQNTNGSGYSNYGSKRTVDADENSWDFTVSAKGYYKARVRAKDVNNNYTSWSSLSLDMATVTSEDVSGSTSSTVSTKSGPGSASTTSANSSTYVGSGPGASGSSKQGNGSSGTGYGTSSQTLTSKKVMVNTYTALGWQSDGKGRWYLYEDGSYPVSSWRKIDGSFYHFNEYGYMDWNRWIREGNNNWYFVTADGKMAVGWNNISEAWYYMDPANGIMYTQGEHIIDGKYYYMNADGSRVHDAWVNGHFYDAKGVRQNG